MLLLNRVRKAISASQVGLEPHSWTLPSPSSYPTPKPGGKLQTVIPNPKIFANAHIPGHIEYNTEKNPLVYPDVSHAAVHLALLECFYNLRLSATEVELDCPPAYEERLSHDDGAESTPHDTHRWHTLIRLAVTRFEAWWANIDAVLNHAAIYAYRPTERIGVQLTKDYLPPLDVLFVWYTFMLETDAYRLECGDPRHSDHVRQLCFPWAALREVLDVHTMEYALPRAAEVLFDTMSGQSAELPSYLRDPPAYAEHDMPLHVDLFDVAKRHDDFIDEAHRLLWIRGPSLYGSLERASVAYFALQLLEGGEAMDGDRALHFGVELIWRTHRLYSEQYECFQRVMRDYPKYQDGRDIETTQQRSATLSSPDTSEPLDVLDSNESSSSSSSEICICWTCERIRDDVPEFVHPAPSSEGEPSSPTVPSQLVGLSSAQIRQILDDLGFFKAVEEARSGGRALPVRSSSGAEQDADKMAGSMAGLFEYFEKMPDGTYKVRKQTQAVAWSGLQV